MLFLHFSKKQVILLNIPENTIFAYFPINSNLSKNLFYCNNRYYYIVAHSDDICNYAICIVSTLPNPLPVFYSIFTNKTTISRKKAPLPWEAFQNL